jgi:hypothetical protein
MARPMYCAAAQRRHGACRRSRSAAPQPRLPQRCCGCDAPLAASALRLATEMQRQLPLLRAQRRRRQKGKRPHCCCSGGLHRKLPRRPDSATSASASYSLNETHSCCACDAGSTAVVAGTGPKPLPPAAPSRDNSSRTLNRPREVRCALAALPTPRAAVEPPLAIDEGSASAVPDAAADASSRMRSPHFWAYVVTSQVWVKYSAHRKGPVLWGVCHVTYLVKAW